MAAPNIEDVVKGYVTLRDRKAKLKKKHSEELLPYTERMLKIEGWLLKDLQSRKVQSQKTAEGTAFIQKSTKATVRDRDAFLKHVKDTDAWDLLENRVAKSVVEDHLENTGEIIPGVHYEKTLVVRVRR